MALFQTEGAAIHLIAWVVPLLGCWFAWPILRRRRSYLVTAAVLYLTPMPVYYSFFTTWYFWWPLVLCLPAYLSSWEALQEAVPDDQARQGTVVPRADRQGRTQSLR